ncbi:MAG: cation diffusion facilitator family transporter [Nitrososphaeraceae archaeon]
MVKDHNKEVRRKYNDEDNRKEFLTNLQGINAYKDKRKVAITSVIASVGLASIKLMIGYSTNSLGILSEGMHSGLDVIAAFMTLYAIQIVIRPPDARYTFGYAKFESLSSFVAIILLFAVAGWIFYEGIDRILFKNIHPEITIFSFVIMFLSVVVDLGRSKALYRTARKYGSQALEADALHFRADMLSSSIVIIGLISVSIFHIPNADAYAALVIAGMIIYTSLGLGRRTLDVLLDKAPKGMYHLLLESISGLDGVTKAHDIRIRNMGTSMSVDLHIEVPRTCTHDKAHRIATTVENRIREIMPNCDVLVHVDAIESSTETLTDRIRLIAAETDGIRNIHSLYLSRIVSSASPPFLGKNQKPKTKDDHDVSSDSRNHDSDMSEIWQPLHLYLDVQVDRRLDLKAAHNIVESFEARIKTEIPQVKDITTHIETESTDDTEVMGVEKEPSPYTTENIRKLCLKTEGVMDCQDIGIVDVNGEQHVTLTIIIKAATEKTVTSVEEAHKISTSVQDSIMKEIGAARVVVHTEPF